MTLHEKKQREEARIVITRIVADVCADRGYTYGRIAIRNQRSRLGSCSSKGNLNFNWQIMKFPEDMRNYIIMHELAHLKQHNHSKAFWQEVHSLDPDYKEHHKWVRKNAKDYLVF